MNRFIVIAASVALALPSAWADVEVTTWESLLRQADSSHPSLTASRAQAEEAEARRKHSRAAFFPELGVAGGWETYRSTEERFQSGFGFAYGRWNLFKGGRDRYQLLARSAEEELAELRLEITRAEISQKLARHFYQLLYLQESSRLIQQGLELNETLRAMARRKIQAGLTTQADTLEFDLSESRLRADLSLIQEEQAQEEAALHVALGQTPRAETQAREYRGELEPDLKELRVEEWLEAAKRRRLPIQEAFSATRQAQYRYRSSWAGFLPRVDLEAMYGRLSLDDREVVGVPQGAVQLRFTLPLFEGLASVYERKADARALEASEARLDSARLETELEARKLASRIRGLQERLLLEEKNLDRAKNYYELTLSDYRRGVKNSPDLAGAAERLFEARGRRLSLARDLRLGWIDLAALTGREIR